MDTSAPDIYFDNNGFCNFCNDFLKNKNKFNNSLSLNKLIKEIKITKKNNKYDCLIGISGGIDSCWAIKKAVDCGLNPLAVHFDNGWNTNLSQENIYKLLKKLDIDLITYVVDWDEYVDIQKAFFKSNVVDIELINDNALIRINYEIAHKYKIKYILAGTNNATEGMRMPQGWNWFKYDKKNIKSIYKKYGSGNIKSLPTIGTIDYIYFGVFKKIKWISFLDYFEYNKNDAMQELNKFSNFHVYEGKHFESIFTRFYQAYILPKKFNIEK
ncbi:N-acetyl sugar amidotransferase, partial [Alphaproteobacteria bacterium]|nr:N-acetyl sugar amidotransferase [Alphaproteobacteria bacterium]